MLLGLAFVNKITEIVCVPTCMYESARERKNKTKRRRCRQVASHSLAYCARTCTTVPQRDALSLLQCTYVPYLQLTVTSRSSAISWARLNKMVPNIKRCHPHTPRVPILRHQLVLRENACINVCPWWPHVLSLWGPLTSLRFCCLLRPMNFRVIVANGSMWELPHCSLK